MQNLIKKSVNAKSIIFFVILAAVLCIPVFDDNGSMERIMHLVITVTAYIALAQSWNILAGITGLFSLGHASYYGIGGYCMAIAMARLGQSPLVGLLMGLAISAFFGLVLGAISSKLTGFFFTMSTLALGQVVRTIATQWTHVTNGVIGLQILRPVIDRAVFFYIFIAMAIAASVLFYYIRRSRMGSMFVSIRENVNLSGSLGVHTVKYKTIASVISAIMASIVGSVLAYYIQVVDVSYVAQLVSQRIIIVPIIGGIGYVWGPVFGSSLVLLEEIIRGTLGSVYASLATALYGLILILFMLFRPEGIISLNIKRTFGILIKALKPDAGIR